MNSELTVVDYQHRVGTLLLHHREDPLVVVQAGCFE